MAQTKRKRRSKHRGNAAGNIETRGRTGRKPAPAVDKKAARAAARREKLSQPPTWNRAILRAGAAAALLFVLTQVKLIPNSDIAPGQALVICLFAMLIYIPLGYMFDNWMYRRMTKPQEPS